MSKNNTVEKVSGLVQFNDIDPGTEALISHRGKEKPGKGKGKPGHAGQKGTDNRGASKKTLYLDLDTQALIERLAQAENVPQADIIAAAVRLLDQALRRGLDLSPFKSLVYSDKQAWRSVTRIELPDDFDFFSGITQP